MKKILLILLVMMICIPMALAGQMSRTVSPATVAPGAKFNIIYTSPTAVPQYWTVDEGLPDGFKTSDATYRCDNNEPTGGKWWGGTYKYKCIARFEGTSIPYTLEVTAPSVKGTYHFDEGHYALWADSSALDSPTTFPSLTIIVGDGVCVEDWECTDWSECDEETKTQTRTCTDKNACGTATDKPEETQDCGTNALLEWIKETFGIKDDLMAWVILLVGGMFVFMIVMMLFQQMMKMMR